MKSKVADGRQGRLYVLTFLSESLVGCCTIRRKMHRIRMSRPSSCLGGTCSILESRRHCGIDKIFISGEDGVEDDDER